MKSALCLVLVAICSFSVAAHATEIPFSDRHIIGSLSAVHAATVADLDGDGDLDVAATGSNGNGVEWYENGGSASSWTEHTVNLGFDGRQVHAADLDDDGDLDLLGGAYNGGGVSWFENLFGDATSWTTHAINDAISSFPATAGDLNGDGDLDVAGSNYWWENSSGDATTWTQSPLGTALTDVHITDVDGDGDADIAGAGSNQLWWWDNESGDATTLTRYSIDSLSGAASIDIADVDGDGKMDAVASGGTEVAWWSYDGPGGGDWSKTSIDAALGSSEWVRAADLDADGDVDVLVNDRGGNFMLWYENSSGDGSTWIRREIESGPSNLRSIEAADLDGDGDLDAVGVGISYSQVWWWENLTLHGSSVFPSKTAIGNATPYVRSSILADLDGDADLDFALAADQSIHSFENLLGDGSAWGAATTVTTGLSSVRSLSSADIDADGFPDLVAGSSTELAWFENPAPSGSWTKHVVSGSLIYPGGVVARDMDDDGDLDLTVTSGNGILWYENDGSGWTQRVVDSTTTGSFIDVGDIDGDGRLDVVFTENTTNLVRYYHNDGGSPPSWTASTISSNAHFPALADMDGDGDLDLLHGTGSESIYWIENTLGDGSAWTAHEILFEGYDFAQLEAVDLDRDGDMDVVGSTGFQASWWENTDGTATAWTAHSLGESSILYGWVATSGDIDRDGQLDVAAATVNTAEISWWRNRGGQFALPTADAVASAHPNEGSEASVLEIGLEHRGRNGDDAVELATLELLFEATPGIPLSASELATLVDAVHLNLDDGDGVWNPSDAVVHTETAPYALNAGVMTMTLPDDSLDLQAEVGAANTYFLSLDFAAGAGTAVTDTVTVSHLTASSSTSEMASTDIPLRLEYLNNTSATSLTVNALPVVVAPIGTQYLTEGEATSITVAASFNDPEGEELSFDQDGLPAGLSVLVDGTISGAPDAGTATGSPYTVTIYATDPWQATSSAVFQMVVQPVGTIFADGFESGDLSRWSP